CVCVCVCVLDGERRCWCVSSNGLLGVGQREPLFVLECLTEESALTRDLFNLISSIYQDATRGEERPPPDPNLSFTYYILTHSLTHSHTHTHTHSLTHTHTHTLTHTHTHLTGISHTARGSHLASLRSEEHTSELAS